MRLMKVINIVKLSQEAVNFLSAYGIKVEDYKYAQLYDDFYLLRDLKGEKYENAVTTLAKKYQISRSKVIRLLNKYNQPLD